MTAKQNSINLKGEPWRNAAKLIRLSLFSCFSLSLAYLLLCLANKYVINLELFSSIIWLIAIPLIPCFALIAPALWRNICPLSFASTLSSKLKSLFNFKANSNNASAQIARPKGRQAKLYSFVKKHGFWISAGSLFIIAPMRLFMHENSGAFLFSILLLLLGLAITAGFLLPYKSGWCSSICPLYAVEQMYAIEPVVRAENTQCFTKNEVTKKESFCSGCVSNCLDRKSAPEDNSAYISGRNDLKIEILASLFPGFIVGFNLAKYISVQNNINAISLESISSIYFLIVLSMFVSRLCYLFARSLTKHWEKEFDFKPEETKEICLRSYVFISFILYYGFSIPNALAFLDSYCHLGMLNCLCAGILSFSFFSALGAVWLANWFSKKREERQSLASSCKQLKMIEQFLQSDW
jgi:hypothetical protein